MRERELFKRGLVEHTSARQGVDLRIRRTTTAQRREQEQTLKEVMRGNITYGTPIEIS
jgi:uncharacterized NAD(P)/FAD-binding protein YdhS